MKGDCDFFYLTILTFFLRMAWYKLTILGNKVSDVFVSSEWHVLSVLDVS